MTNIRHDQESDWEAVWPIKTLVPDAADEPGA
jgi:hypothetical protein